MEALWQWLLTPISGAFEHTISPTTSWHGRIMVLCWGVAVPLAVLAARFYKVTPNQHWPEELDNKFWWNVHRLLNYSSVVGSLLAVAVLFNQNTYTSTQRDIHVLMGWTLVVFGLLQVAGGLLRGTKGGPTAPRMGPNDEVLDFKGDHYDMTPHRLLFERVHKTLGYTALALAALTILMGLWTADAPRWMWLGVLGWWLACIAVFVRLQRQGRCLDTYQAIWGPGIQHPGNSAPVVGWGVRRVKDLATPAPFETKQ